MSQLGVEDALISEFDRVHNAQTLSAGEYIKKPYIKVKLGTAVKKELAKKR